MTNCKCFQCKTDYQSANPDDIAGDGRCPSCAERAKAMAIKVNAEVSAQRFADRSNLRDFVDEEQIQGLKIDPATGRVIGGKAIEPIRLNSLGITPHG